MVVDETTNIDMVVGAETTNIDMIVDETTNIEMVVALITINQ